VTVARLETRSDGYFRWRSWDPFEGRERYVYVHQLLVIADGACPYRVFSDGQFHVHHVNHIRFDNRSANLELRRSADHGAYHAEATSGGSP